ALLVAPFGQRLDRFWRPAVTEALRRHARWCIVFNGTHLRIVDAGRVYARRFVEFDLGLALLAPAASRALQSLASAAALTGAAGDARSLHSLVSASDCHAAGVCKSLRDGVLRASADLISALAPRRRGHAPQLHASF